MYAVKSYALIFRMGGVLIHISLLCMFMLDYISMIMISSSSVEITVIEFSSWIFVAELYSNCVYHSVDHVCIVVIR
jgi:hypothetical protein